MNDWTTKEYVAAIIATIAVFLLLRALFRWIGSLFTRGGAAGGGGAAAPAHTTHTSSHTFTLDWVGFAKAVALVLVVGTLLYFAIGLYGPAKELAARFMTSITPSTTVIDWSNWDYTQPKFWIVVAIILVVIFLIYKLLFAAITAFGTHAPATAPPTNWDSIGRGLFALAALGCVFFLMRGCSQSEPATQLAKKLAEKISSEENSSSKKSSALSKNSANEDKGITQMNPAERDKNIEILQNRLEQVWQIPSVETDQILAKSLGIPGGLFWRNMERVYDFKRLPAWGWSNLPSSVIAVPETIHDPKSDETVAYTYTLPVNVCKEKFSRPIAVRGWNDWIDPKDPKIDSSYYQVLDRSTSPNPTTVYYSAKTKRFYVYNDSGRPVLQDIKWIPRPVNEYELRLPPNHPSTGEVRFLIHRTRHNMRIGDPEGPSTRTE